MLVIRLGGGTGTINRRIIKIFSHDPILSDPIVLDPIVESYEHAYKTTLWQLDPTV